MAEYIERETLVERLTRNLNACNPGTFSEMCYQDAINTVTAFPAADVAPVRHGRWVHDYYENCSENFEIVKCTNCGHKAYAVAFYVKSGNYCPNCGAKMDLEGRQ